MDQNTHLFSEKDEVSLCQMLLTVVTCSFPASVGAITLGFTPVYAALLGENNNLISSPSCLFSFGGCPTMPRHGLAAELPSVCRTTVRLVEGY